MKTRLIAFALVVGCVVLGQPDAETTVQARAGRTYLIQVTNVTPGQAFTPILAATHTGAMSLFNGGTPASPELRMLAEGGDVGPLTSLLLGLPEAVLGVVSSSGLTTPGVTTSMTIMGGDPFDRISLATMLIPTNDTFLGVNTTLPAYGEEKVVFAYAWDAGTEINDERVDSRSGLSRVRWSRHGGLTRTRRGRHRHQLGHSRYRRLRERPELEQPDRDCAYRRRLVTVPRHHTSWPLGRPVRLLACDGDVLRARQARIRDLCRVS